MWPIITPPFVIGLGLVLLFGNPIVLGDNFRVLSTEIFFSIASAHIGADIVADSDLKGVEAEAPMTPNLYCCFPTTLLAFTITDAVATPRVTRGLQ